MRLRKQRPAPAPPEQGTKPGEPEWQRLLDPQERPTRENLAADHDPFGDAALEPVPMPRWLRGRRRAPRDKLS